MAITVDSRIHRTVSRAVGNDRLPGAFTWALYPLDEARSRLVSRIRWSYDPTSVNIFSPQLFTEFADHIAVRKILQGVKQRVERDIEPVWVQYVELLIFVCTLVTFLIGLTLLGWRGLTWQTCGAGMLAGVIWLTTWYAPTSRCERTSHYHCASPRIAILPINCRCPGNTRPANTESANFSQTSWARSGRPAAISPNAAAATR